MAGYLKEGVGVAVTLYLSCQNIPGIAGLPCSSKVSSDNSTAAPCVPSQTTISNEPEQTVLFSTPYIFIVLCSLVFLPFFILLKVWWVKRLQKSQYQSRLASRQNEEPEIAVIDHALFAPPPSYEECMAKPPPYDYLPAYKDLKFGPEVKTYVPNENLGTSSRGSLPQ